MKKVLSIALVSAMALTGVLASTNTAQAAINNGSTVTVEKGDTYKSIAAANGISISALEQANGREVGGFDLIFPGETIVLPGTNADTTASTTTTDNTNTQATTDTSTSADTQAATTDTTNTDTSANTQATTDTSSQATTQSTTTTGTSQGTFKISFYDPAVLGSNMGYSGVAANLSVFPKGTQLKITLSDGTVLYRTVNDTGTFAYSNPNQLDVAMPSSSIPSYGVTTASVEVLS
ncbi:LysM peptidoglycan-binding domain-containing protein [Companilactobacillus sp. FL22-1]|uniref:DPBB and LysM peptidoglycan-binding domain-containing protein n=1 Tax=Companilactobacillus sp. FL22-1 TaxID=3373892 RepID=UPI00375437B8